MTKLKEYIYPKNYSSKNKAVEFFNEFGFLSLKGIIPQEQIDVLIRDLIFLFEPYSGISENPIDSAIINLDRGDKEKLFSIHSSMYKLMSIKKLSCFFTDYIQKTFCLDKPILEISSGILLGIPNDKRLVYDFHQESSYMKGFSDIFNIHFPILRTSSIENGTMSVLSGSHKLGHLDYDKKRFSENSYTNLTPKDILKIQDSYTEQHCYLEVGDVIIFHKDLIHKSNNNLSELTRPVGVHRLTSSSEGDWVRRSPNEL